MAQQNTLDFNIAANVKGMEAIATLINRVGALETETKKLASANAALSSSTEAVVRNGTRYNNALDAQSKELRNARQGTQQLGMQINDFATSVSTGASVTQALNQQLGQVGYAMSMMGGTAGKVGAFLAGPWGAAITLGVMALGPLIDKLFQSKDAAEQAAQAHYKYLDAVAAGNMADLIKGEMDLTKMQEKRLKLQLQLDNTPLPGAQPGGARFAVPGERSRLQKELDQLDANIRWQQMAVDLGNKAAEQLRRNEQKIQGRVSGGTSGGAASRATQKIKEDLSKVNIAEHNGAKEFIADTIRKGEQSWQEYWNDIPEVAASAMDKIVDINTMATASVNTLGEETSKEWRNRYSEIQQSFTSIGNAVANSFQGMLTGAMSWKDGMKGIINAVINELWRLFVVQQIVGMITGGLNSLFGFSPSAKLAGDVAGTMSARPDLFANGTVNAPGGMAWVGERGPELVNLPRGSQVIPAHRAQSMGGGGVTINVDARGSADPAAVRAQVQQGIIEAAPSIIAAAEARTVQGLRRPRLGGAIK